MLKINILVGNDDTNEWENISLISFIPHSELYPDQDTYGAKQYGLDKEKVNLPNNEILDLRAAYTPKGRGLNFVVLCGGTEILNISCFKQNDSGWDPSVVVRTPNGEYVSFMFGNEA